MPFKDDYLKATRVTNQTYAVEDTAIKRIRSLYGTARKGALNEENAATLWRRFFSPLRRKIQSIPANEKDYDIFAIKQIGLLAKMLEERNLLRNGALGDFGIAQKMFNLFIKHHWALGIFPPATQRSLHLPLDRRVLSKLSNCPGTWATWTRAQNSKDTRKDYLIIQNNFRCEWKRVHLFKSPIEMEQFIWHRVQCA